MKLIDVIPLPLISTLASVSTSLETTSFYHLVPLAEVLLWPENTALWDRNEHFIMASLSPRRLSQEPHEGVWMLLNRLDAIGVYNGCIIIINNHNMII